MINRPVSIIMTYYNRKKQLWNTLHSFIIHQYVENVEVIIVDDNSNIENRLNYSELKDSFPQLSITLISISAKEKNYKNPCVPFNRGIQASKNEIVLLQNAECLHHGNIVRDARRTLCGNEYISYACYSIDEERTNKIQEGFSRSDFETYLKENLTIKNDGDNGWYNHSEYRPVGFHFTAAITRKTLVSLGGFDERFAHGIGFDDYAFLKKMKNEGVTIKIVDSEVVIHQWHYLGKKPWNYKYLHQKNRYLYDCLFLNDIVKGYISCNIVARLFIFHYVSNRILNMSKLLFRHLIGDDLYLRIKSNFKS